ncbi:MAG TPA: hypothetical protein V6C65_04275 [Allocoleopsis sp.]
MGLRRRREPTLRERITGRTALGFGARVAGVGAAGLGVAALAKRGKLPIPKMGGGRIPRPPAIPNRPLLQSASAAKRSRNTLRVKRRLEAIGKPVTAVKAGMKGRGTQERRMISNMVKRNAVRARTTLGANYSRHLQILTFN